MSGPDLIACPACNGSGLVSEERAASITKLEIERIEAFQTESEALELLTEARLDYNAMVAERDAAQGEAREWKRRAGLLRDMLLTNDDSPGGVEHDTEINAIFEGWGQ